MTPFGWGLVGPGKIAHRFAEAVQRTEGMRLVAVTGRDRARAEAFAGKWAMAGEPIEATVDIAALLANLRVDALYIAPPHPFHADAIRRALAAGKPVLCEKPLVPDLPSGLAVVEMARRNQVFLMEAVWTRFLPIYGVVAKWLSAGAIGRVRAIQSSFCFNLPYDTAHRAYDPAQAGGALLDIGIYNLTMTRWVMQQALGACPPLQSLHARATRGPTGVDHRLDATLELAGGIVSQFVCAFDTCADNALTILGEHGSIAVPTRFWEATAARLAVPGRDDALASRPFRVNGFEYEVEEAVRVIRAGGLESAAIPLEETLETLRWMSRIREMVGVRYPFEKAMETA
jgi:predicted dehydrogenase